MTYRACVASTLLASTMTLSSASSAAVPPASALKAFQICAESRGGDDTFSGVVVVAEQGRPGLQLSYGLADPASGRRNTPETRFNFASMGKMFTAVAIAQLFEKGKLQFEDPVGRFVKGLPPEVAAVTIDQLLTHKSGLGDYARPENRPAILAARSATDLLPVALIGGLAFAPGTKQAYSNSGYVLLGAIIEAVSGLGYSEYVQRHIFTPAGMTSSSLDGVAGRAVALTSRSLDGGGAQGARRPAPTIGGLRASPAGGAVGSALDLVRFGEALRRHRLISKATLERLWLRHVPGKTTAGQSSSYGYGFTRVDAGGDYVVGHGGGSIGVNSHFDFYPRTGRSVVVLANYDPPAATNLIEASRRAFLSGVSPAGICNAQATDAVRPQSDRVEGSRPSIAQAVVGPAEAEVRALERKWLDAYETRDAAAMDAILADDFTITYPDGALMAKGDVLAQLQQRAGRPNSRFSTENVEARVSADRMVLTGILVMQSPRGARRNRYTDTWVRRAGTWQVVASKLAADSSAQDSQSRPIPHEVNP